MFEPIFDPGPPTLFGIDARLLILVIGLVLAGIGVLWIRRVLEIEPDVHSFRSTAPAPPNVALRAGIALAVFVAVLIAIQR